jgi:hypothetical protein
MIGLLLFTFGPIGACFIWVNELDSMDLYFREFAVDFQVSDAMKQLILLLIVYSLHSSCTFLSDEQYQKHVQSVREKIASITSDPQNSSIHYVSKETLQSSDQRLLQDFSDFSEDDFENFEFLPDLEPEVPPKIEQMTISERLEKIKRKIDHDQSVEDSQMKEGLEEIEEKGHIVVKDDELAPNVDLPPTVLNIEESRTPSIIQKAPPDSMKPISDIESHKDEDTSEEPILKKTEPIAKPPKTVPSPVTKAAQESEQSDILKKPANKIESHRDEDTSEEPILKKTEPIAEPPRIVPSPVTKAAIRTIRHSEETSKGH